MTLTTAESLGIISLKTTSITTGTDGSIAIIAGTSLDMKSKGKLSINSEEEVDIDGEVINLN